MVSEELSDETALDGGVAGDGLLSVVEALMEVMGEDPTTPAPDAKKVASATTSTDQPGFPPPDGEVLDGHVAEADSQLMAGLSSMLGGYGSDAEDEPDFGVGSVSVETETLPVAGNKNRSESGQSGGPSLCPGCHVQVSGLRKATDLNGRQGTARRPDPASPQRWQVELQATCSQPRVVKSIHRDNLLVLAASEEESGSARPPGGPAGEEASQTQPLAPGCEVRVIGLQNASHLNGCYGTVRRADPSHSGRWEIEIHRTKDSESGVQSEIKRVKAENLVRVVGRQAARHEGGDIEDGSGAQTAPGPSAAYQPGVWVWVSGVQTFDGQQGRLLRRDPECEGKWEVGFEGEDGRIQTQASFLEKNLVPTPTLEEGEEAFVQDDGYGVFAQDTDDEDRADEEAEEEEQGDGCTALKEGSKVRITGLCSAAAKHLNDQVGILCGFDASAGRWKVRLEGGELKAIKPENLVRQAAAAEAKGEAEGEEAGGEMEGGAAAATPEEDGDANANLEVYSEWDANEIAAAAVQAELNGEAARAATLQKLLRVRRAQDATLAARGLEEGPVIEEQLDLPEEAVGRVIGRGGEAVMRLTAESGARITIMRVAGGPARTRRCTILGLASEVAKAQQLLQEAVAEALAAVQKGRGPGKGKGKGKGKGRGSGGDLLGEGASGRAGFAGGVCKWFAAGFCRNNCGPASGGPGACRNGLHSGDAAKRAEADWVREGPEPGTVSFEKNERPLLLLLDLEGGGNKDGRDGEDEIIEMPVLSMCPTTGRELGRFHRYIRPGFWTREAASMQQRFAPACFNAEANAVPFPEAVADLCTWLCSLLRAASLDALASEQFLFVTCGNWDVKTCIPRQCHKPPGAVSPSLQRLLFSRWCNLKEVFREHYRLPQEVAPTGMRGMLRRLGIPLMGQHHLGMDDVSNLSKILQRLVSEGCPIKATGQAALGPSPVNLGFAAGKGVGFPSGGPFWSQKGKGLKGKDKGKDKGKGLKGKGKGKFPFPFPGPCLAKGQGHAVPEVEFEVGGSGPSWPGKGKPAPVPAPRPPPQQPLPTPLGPTAEPGRPGAGGQQDLDFLRSAPLPGRSWSADVDSEEEPGPLGIGIGLQAAEAPKPVLKRPLEGLLLAGVLPQPGVGLGRPEKVAKISSLLAQLPAPRVQAGTETDALH